MNTWYNADGNLFKLKTENGAVLLRAYRKVENSGIERESYRLDPELLKLNTVNGKLRLEYEDFYIEPYLTGADESDSFSIEADAEYENADALPAEMNFLVCPIAVFE